MNGHSVTLCERSHISITCVDEIISFDETLVSMSVDGSVLNVSGSSLSMRTLSLENGQVEIDGSIEAVVYFDQTKKKKGIRGLFS